MILLQMNSIKMIPLHQDDPPSDELHQDDPPSDELHQDDPPSDELHQDDPPSDELHQDDPPSDELHQDDPPSDELHQDDPPSDELHQDDPPSDELHQDDPPSDELHQDDPPSDELHQDDPPSDELEICCIKVNYLNNISVMVSSPAIFFHLLHENHKTYEEAVQLQSTFKLRLWNTPLRHRKNPSLPQRFTDKSRLIHFSISDCSIIHLSLFCIFRFFPAFLFKCRATLTTTFMVLSGVPGLLQNVFFPSHLYVCVCVSLHQ